MVCVRMHDWYGGARNTLTLLLQEIVAVCASYILPAAIAAILRIDDGHRHILSAT